jgi:hypothetical protein
MLLLIIMLIVGMLVCKTMKGAALFGCLGFLIVVGVILFGAVGMVALSHP